MVGSREKPEAKITSFTPSHTLLQLYYMLKGQERSAKPAIMHQLSGFAGWELLGVALVAAAALRRLTTNLLRAQHATARRWRQTSNYLIRAAIPTQSNQHDVWVMLPQCTREHQENAHKVFPANFPARPRPNAAQRNTLKIDTAGLAILSGTHSRYTRQFRTKQPSGPSASTPLLSARSLHFTP